MLNKRRDAAMKVAQGLFALEKAIDEALAQAAELNAIMPAAWSEAGISPVVGQDAFDEAAACFAALARARNRVVVTHTKLDEARNQIGLRTVSFGGGAKASMTPGLALAPVPANKAA
jgi:hypothetical protein